MPSISPKSFTLDCDSIITPDVMSPFSPNKSILLSEALANGHLIIDYHTMKLIASGGQGDIYKVQVKRLDPESGRVQEELTCVLKRKFLPKKSAETQSPLFRAHGEVTEGSSTLHKVLPLLGVVEHEEQQYALLPLCQTFLDKEIKRIQSLKTDPLFFTALVVGMLKNTLTALEYLHETKKVVHGDIKPNNIPCYNGIWCLADFDSTTHIASSKIPETNPYFKHPATIANYKLSSQPFNDIFALGTIVKTLLNPKEWEEKASKPIGVFFSESVDEYQQYKDASMKEDREGLSDALLQLPPLAALNKIANHMCTLNEKEIPSASDLLDLVLCTRQFFTPCSPVMHKQFELV